MKGTNWKREYKERAGKVRAEKRMNKKKRVKKGDEIATIAKKDARGNIPED